jgi:hypothetical protein
MAPLPIALVPGRCPGFQRLNGTKAPLCHTCGCYTLRRPDIEPAAKFVDGRFDCVNWRGHSVTVHPSGETRKTANVGGAL